MSRNALAAGSSLLEENQVSRNALAAGSSLQTSPFALQTSSSFSPTRLLIPIEEVPLGARIPTKNPRPWEYDDSLPEPDQATWAKLSITMYRTDGGIVDAELIRPRSWIKSIGIEAGKLLASRHRWGHSTLGRKSFRKKSQNVCQDFERTTTN